jgi:P4 family phage/plasmid primase-like protien
MPKIVQGLKKEYTKYDTIESIAEIEKLCKTKKNCYISYTNDEIHKLYIDVDLKEPNYIQYGNYETMKLKVYNDILTTFKYFRPSIAESHDNKNKKISFRVIINGIKLKISEMADYLLDNYKDEFQYNIVDKMVYSTGGKIRLPYCSKDGENRPLNIIMGEFKDFITSNVENAELRTCTKEYIQETINQNNKEVYNDLDNDEIKEILFSLPPKYYDEYELWFKIGAICKTINEYNLFVEFSKQSTKYDEQALNKYWAQFKQGKFNVNSLFYFLKLDNSTKYKEISERKAYNFTERGMSKLFYKLKPHNYLYSKNLKWYVLGKNNIWYHEYDEPNQLTTDISDTLINYYNNIINSLDKTKEQDREKIIYICKFLNQVQTLKFCKNVIGFIINEYTVNNLEFIMDENRDLIAFNNGVYDLNTSTFRDIKPTDYISLTTGYDLDINKNESIRKDIKVFIQSCFNTDDDVEYLLKTMAYGISGNNKLEEFYIWTGKGGNGKGTINELLRRSLGDYYNTQSTDILTKTSKGSNEHDTLGRAKGKRFLIATEPNTANGDVFNIAKINLLTGNDMITSREIFKKQIEFKPQFTIYIQVNEIPELSSVGQSIKRRLRIINFPFNFVDTVTNATIEREKNPNYKNKIQKCNLWRNEFMLLLLDYYKDYILNCNEIKPPTNVNNIINEYLDDNDKIKQWIIKYYDITENNNDKIKNTDFFRKYQVDNMDNIIKRKQFYNTCSLNGMNYIEGSNREQFYHYIKRKTLFDNT